MTDAATFRDSTEILLPASALSGLRDDVESEFTVTVVADGEARRIIGSPAEIKRVSDYLARQGVALP